MYLKDPTKRVQYTFRIKEDLMEDLKVYAKAKDMKLPQLLNNIIEEYLEGMNMSNTWSNEPLRAIITIPNELPIKDHANVLLPRDGLQFEVKAMPYNLDTWNDKYGYIANTKGIKHKGVEPLIIPGLIKDIKLEKNKTTAKTIAQCLFGLYFTLHDTDMLHVEIISINNATGQLQFVNPDMAKMFAQYRKMLYDIINDHLARLNNTNHDHIKQQLLEQLEDLALTINTGNVVPIIAPAEDNTLQSDNPYLNGTKKFIAGDQPVIFFDNAPRYEEMKKEIDKLKKQNKELQKDLESATEVLQQTNEQIERLKRIEEIFDMLESLTDDEIIKKYFDEKQ